MAGSLRDQLSEAFDEVTKEEPVQQEAPVQETVAPAETATTEPEKPGRTYGRERDEKGRLLPGPAKRETPAAEGQPTAPSTTAQAQTPPAAEPLKPLPRPSSWKKEMWPVWEKLEKGTPLSAQEARQLAEYNLQREGDFAKGVSTYKQEWERAKPLLDAVAPHLQDFQRWGIDPAQQFSKYVEIHKGLAMGSPQDKLGMLLRIAQDYQIPLQQLFVRGQDGQVYFNPQVQPAQPAPQQRQQQPDVRQTVQEILAQERAAQEAAAMEADTQKYPHFAEVKQSMAGLLQAGLAQDLQSAYDAALRLPNHFHLFEAQQQQQRQKEEQERVEAQRRVAEAARRNQVSPRTSSPAGQASKGSTKGLRSTLEAAFDEHVTGRV